MKGIAVVLFLIYTICIYAEQLWEQPVEVYRYDNIVFQGAGTTTSDNNILLTWNEGAANDRHGYVQKYNSQMQPAWINPLIVPETYFDTGFIQTSDSSTVMVWYETGFNECIKVQKIGNDGLLAWGQNGVVAIPGYYSGHENYQAVADTSGGVFISIWHQVYNDIRLQHINADGTISFPQAGIIIAPHSTTSDYIVSMIAMGGDVIVAYCNDNTANIERIQSDGTILWTTQIPVDYQLTNTNNIKLIKCNSNSFYLVNSNASNIKVQLIADTGSPMWNMPTVVSESTSATIRWNSVSLCCTNEGLLNLCWSNGDREYVQKLNPAGQLLWLVNGCYFYTYAEDCNLSKVCLGNSNDIYVIVCYRYMNADTGQQTACKVQHVSADGTMGSASLILFDTYSSTWDGGINVQVLNGNFIVNWSGYGNEVSGIYAQAINPMGNTLYPNPYYVVNSAGSGSGSDNIIVRKGNDVLATWLVSSQKAYYKIISQDGSSFFPPNGMPLSSIVNSKTALATASSPDNYALIAWIEDESRVIAQLINPEGFPLWGSEGMYISELSYTSELSVSYSDNSFYVIWIATNAQNHLRIYGQRFSQGITQWGAMGVQLVSDNPEHPNATCTDLKVNGKYITWLLMLYTNFNIGNAAYVSRFDADGQLDAGYNAYGNRIADFEENSEYQWGQIIGQTSLMNDDLVATIDNFTTINHGGWDEDIHQYIIQRISPDGSYVWDNTGLEWDNSYFSICYNEIYKYSGNPYYRLTKYDTDLHPVWNYIDTIHGFYTLVSEAGSNRLLFDSIRLEPSSQLSHYYFDLASQTFIYPSDYILTNYPGAPLVVKLDANNIIAWGESNSYGSDFNQVFKLMLVSNYDVGNDDPITVSSELSLSKAFPNPFTHETKVCYYIPKECRIMLSVYNIKGQLVKTIIRTKQAKGSYQVSWDGTDTANLKVSAGVYFYRLEAANKTLTKKFLLLK